MRAREVKRARKSEQTRRRENRRLHVVLRPRHGDALVVERLAEVGHSEHAVCVLQHGMVRACE